MMLGSEGRSSGRRKSPDRGRWSDGRLCPERLEDRRLLSGGVGLHPGLLARPPVARAAEIRPTDPVATRAMAHSAGSSHFLSATDVGSTGPAPAFAGAEGVATDGAGDVYVVGTFGNAGDTAQFGTHSITSATDLAIYVAKFSPAEGWLWATAIDPGGPPFLYQGAGIVIDALGRVDIVGTSIDPSGPTSIIVSQLDPGTGAIDWTRSFAGELTGEAPYGGGTGTGITAQGVQDPSDPTQTPLLDITGTIFGTINFPGPVASPGLNDLFVGQLTEAGTPVWGSALPIPTTTDASGGGIAVDEARGQIFAAGTEGTPQGRLDLVVAKYNSITGAFEKSATLRRVSSGQAPAVAVDGRGHLYVAGTGPSRSAVVAKLAETGLRTIWSRNFVASGRGSSAMATGIAVNNRGAPFITGSFGGRINLGAGTMSSKGSPTFVAKLNAATGLASWSAAAGPGVDVAVSIAYDPLTTGEFYIAGDYAPPATFGKTTLGGVVGSPHGFLASFR